jgi:AraC-like DNA-binding protein
MNQELLEELKNITQEEKRILEGKVEIEKERYMYKETDIIDANKLMEDGKWIQVRLHTRFVYFPKHSHNFIEVIYMCSGTTHHIINGAHVILQKGELLFLNQTAEQEIYPALEQDIAVNFIILPEFFERSLNMIEYEKNMLRDFVIDCLKGKKGAPGYMHFKVTEILPIQNLIENLIWSIWNKKPNRRSANQVTMGLLFLHLMNYMDQMETDEAAGQQQMIIQVLHYIEEHYRDGELSKLAEHLHYDLYYISREIKRHTGQTFTELLQSKRLSQAAYLLINTNMSVIDISLAIGYENISYFHRIFHKFFDTTPRKYRIAARKQAISKLCK